MQKNVNAASNERYAKKFEEGDRTLVDSLIESTLADIEKMITMIVDKGGRQFLIFGIPDMTLMPSEAENNTLPMVAIPSGGSAQIFDGQ